MWAREELQRCGRVRITTQRCGPGEFGRLVLGRSSTIQCSGPSRGKAFPPHPHFHPVPGFHFPWVALLLPRRPLWGLTCRPLAANSSPPAVGGLWQRAFASLRSTALLNRAATLGAGEELLRCWAGRVRAATLSVTGLLRSPVKNSPTHLFLSTTKTNASLPGTGTLPVGRVVRREGEAPPSGRRRPPTARLALDGEDAFAAGEL